MALTDTAIRNVKTGERPRKLFDSRGLYLLIMPGGSRWWRLKYRFASKEKLISLGTYPDIGLKLARKRRDEARKLLAEGLDPGAERKSKKSKLAAEASSSFEAVAREWFEKFSKGWAITHAHTVIRRLEANAFPQIGNKPIAEITPIELLSLLRRVEARGAVSTAHRIKQILGQVFRFAIATGRASRDPSADLRGALAPERERHFGALTNPADVAGLMRAIGGYQGSFVVKCALYFSALTFGRPGEIRRAEWNEMDIGESLWRISAERMKMRREHLVPLSRQALSILQKIQPLTGTGRYVFPNGRVASRPMSENAITAALRYMNYERGQMTAHGFRTLASTLLNEHGWPADAIERQLAHAERDEVRGAYNRAEYLAQRRLMMQAWGDYLDALATGGASVPAPSGAGAGVRPNGD
jgi:integrase